MAITKVTTDVITDGAVTAPKLATDSVTADKLAANSVTAAKIAAGTLTDQVANNSITAAKIPNATALTLDGGVTIDNINIDGTTMALSSGDLTLDVAGEIRLSADDNGEVHFYDGSLHYGSILEENSNLLIRSIVDNEDILFQGYDATVLTTALTLDMSKAGSATFNHDVILGDNGQAIFGANDDLRIYHSGTYNRNYIQATGSNHDLTIAGDEIALTNSAISETFATFVADGAVTLKYDNSTKLATASGGVTVTGTLTVGDGHTIGNDGDDNLAITGSANENIIIDSADDIILDADGGDVIFRDGGAEKMRLDAGDLGIGTASPDYQLHIAGGGDLLVEDTGNGSAHIRLRSSNSGTATSNWKLKTSSNNFFYIDNDTGSAGTAIAIDNAGKVGIGETTPLGKLHIKEDDSGVSSVNSNFDQLVLEDDSHSGMTILSGTSGDGAIYFGDSGSNDMGQIKYKHGTNQLDLTTSGAVALTIDSSGKVGIGETVPHEKVHVTGASGVALLMHMDADTADGTSAVLFKNDSTNDDRRIKAGIIYQRDDPGTRGTGDLHLCVNGVNSDTNVSVSDSRLAIHADGNIHTKSLFVDTTTDNSVSNDEGIVISDGGFQVIRRGSTMLYLHHTAGSGTGTLVAINKAQATVGTITATNSNAAYNTSSDYRLKENVDYTWDATTRLKQLKPARFNWVIDSTNTLQDGFMAHEVESIVPEAVTGTKDAVWSAEEEANGEGTEGGIKGQQMDHSKLVPLLVKTVQELEARIKVLEG